MTEKSRADEDHRRNRECELEKQYRAIRIRAVAGALEHQGDRDNAVGRRKRPAPKKLESD